MGTLNDYYIAASAVPIQNRRFALGAGYALYERVQRYGYPLGTAQAQILSVPQYANALTAAGLTATFNAITFPAPATAPTFVAAGTSATGATTDAALTPGLPAGFQADDIGLLVVVTVPADGAVTVPAGWTVAADVTLVRELTVAWRRLQAGDTDPTVTKPAASGWTAQIVAYRGVRNTGNPWAVAPTTGTGSATTAVSVPGVTPTSDKNRIVMVLGRAGGATVTFSGYATTNPDPGVMTEDFEFAALNGSAVASGAQVTAGATGNVTATESATQAYQAAVFALTPT